MSRRFVVPVGDGRDVVLCTPPDMTVREYDSLMLTLAAQSFVDDVIYGSGDE